MNFTPNHPHRLVIHSTLDTRQRDPLTGKRLASTGEVLSCACCGKDIVIHVSVAECEPVTGIYDNLIGYRPVSETAIIGQDCAKKLKAINRQADGCNFKWIQ